MTEKPKSVILSKNLEKWKKIFIVIAPTFLFIHDCNAMSV